MYNKHRRITTYQADLQQSRPFLFPHRQTERESLHPRFFHAGTYFLATDEKGKPKPQPSRRCLSTRVPVNQQREIRYRKMFKLGKYIPRVWLSLCENPWCDNKCRGRPWESVRGDIERYGGDRSTESGCFDIETQRSALGRGKVLGFYKSTFILQAFLIYAFSQS